jgi:hypothetical protein
MNCVINEMLLLNLRFNFLFLLLLFSQIFTPVFSICDTLTVISFNTHRGGYNEGQDRPTGLNPFVSSLEYVNRYIEDYGDFDVGFFQELMPYQYITNSRGTSDSCDIGAFCVSVLCSFDSCTPSFKNSLFDGHTEIRNGVSFLYVSIHLSWFRYVPYVYNIPESAFNCLISSSITCPATLQSWIDENELVRKMELENLIIQLNTMDADVIIIGGDFNTVHSLEFGDRSHTTATKVLTAYGFQYVTSGSGHTWDARKAEGDTIDLMYVKVKNTMSFTSELAMPIPFNRPDFISDHAMVGVKLTFCPV